METEQKTKMTLAENAILTLKLLVMGALFMAVLWGVERWISSR